MSSKGMFLVTGVCLTLLGAWWRLALAAPGVQPPLNGTAQVSPTITPTIVPVAGPSPTPSPISSGRREMTFASLGFGERPLLSPYSTIVYHFGLPAGWRAREGSVLELELSTLFIHVDPAKPRSTSIPGVVIVSLNGEDLKKLLIYPTDPSPMRVSIPLPAANLNQRAPRRHELSIYLDGSILCKTGLQIQFVIEPTSRISLAYDQYPVTPDLADYPRPFYQQALDPDDVFFVLPDRPDEAEMAGAVAMAARLGRLTRAGLTITTTMPFTTSSAAATGHHLVVLGTPDDNRLIPYLNQLRWLPVRLYRRQMGLQAMGPPAATPGSVVSYTVVVSNPTGSPATALTLAGELPRETRLITCAGCTASGRIIQWPLATLAAAQTVTLSYAIRVTDTITTTLPALEQTLTLRGANGRPLNADTLRTILGSGPVEAPSPSPKGSVFFARGAWAVPETSGVLVEIRSPWNPARAVLIVTGLSGEAVRKAAGALSTEAHFPGLLGDYALVDRLRPANRAPVVQPVDFTLADVGYDDQTVQGVGREEIDYRLYIPLGQTPAADATADILFSHSRFLDPGSSALIVLLNDEPIGSALLDADTAVGGRLHIPLPATGFKPGRPNVLTVRAIMFLDDECADPESDQVWMRVSSDSSFHLPHRTVVAHDYFDLDDYSFPFAGASDLSDLALALPAVPTPAERDGILRVAATLGNAVQGGSFRPLVFLGRELPAAEMSPYHVIAVGRPTANPAIAQVNAQLPQPFIPGSDEIEQVIDTVVLRPPPDLSLGFVELVPSPWNAGRAFLVATGTTDEGVRWALETLSDPDLYDDLWGDVDVIRERKITGFDTRDLTAAGQGQAVATAVPELAPLATSELTPTVTAAPATPVALPTSEPIAFEKPGTPAWLWPLVGGNAVLVLVLVGVAAWRARRRKEQL